MSVPAKNWLCLSRLLLDKGTRALQQLFERTFLIAAGHAYGPTIDNANFLAQCHTSLHLNSQQHLSLTGGKPSSQWDISFLAVLIGYGRVPFSGSQLRWRASVAERAALDILRDARNKLYAHLHATEVSVADYNAKLPSISAALQSLGVPHIDIMAVTLQPFDAALVEAHKKLLNDWCEQDKLLAQIASQQQHLEGMLQTVHANQATAAQNQHAANQILQQSMQQVSVQQQHAQQALQQLGAQGLAMQRQIADNTAVDYSFLPSAEEFAATFVSSPDHLRALQLLQSQPRPPAAGPSQPHIGDV
jgi:hypothetical protein